jgi:hypothetical protein
MDLSGQTATHQPTEDRPGIVLVGSSQSVRLMDHLESANLRVIDSTVPGFKITEAAVDELATKLAEKDRLRPLLLCHCDSTAGQYFFSLICLFSFIMC